MIMGQTPATDPRVIVALDFAEPVRAMDLLARLDPGLCRIKIGKELFTRGGPALVEQVMARDFTVFLDLKFHDIPNTVAQACKAAAELGVWMVNVHTLGGRKMLEAARDAVTRSSRQPLLIGVTLLTSMDTQDLRDIGIAATVEEQVVRLASLAQQSGLDGVVCSAQEASMLRQQHGDDFALVTPGIRPADASLDDQSRVMTPVEAIIQGSNYLVIGRPVTRATDPVRILTTINSEISEL